MGNTELGIGHWREGVEGVEWVEWVERIPDLLTDNF